ncbi:homolog of X-ray repair cross complementing 3 [Prunus dulcis]|uniref:Homolog of X-ray repair cross complementing 3 n=1 Tax=Prunus dulcis TaxID=3755 RepID=A0A5H2Y3U5_PRUDU|nr:homolog of X-ray repair cross complementing 3 [Prunus dulcis]
MHDCLGGGIPCNSITELVGESGSGKTQLCLQLTVRAQLPPLHGGLGGSSVYIFTEFSFLFRRLQQLGNLYHASYPNLIRLEPLEDIYVHGVHDAQQLIHVLGDIEAFIAIDHTRLPVKLIVIDSIAALFRSQYQTTPADLKRQSEMFFNISGTLKGLANKFGLVVVVTNQVVDFIGPHDKMNGVRLGNLESLDTSGRRVSPALGLAWAHCINSRVFLARHEQSIEVLLLWPAELHLEHFLLMVPSPCEGILNFFRLPGMTLAMGGSTTRLRNLQEYPTFREVVPGRCYPNKHPSRFSECNTEKPLRIHLLSRSGKLQLHACKVAASS